MAAPRPLFQSDKYAPAIRTGIGTLWFILYERDFNYDENSGTTRYLLYCIEQHKIGPTTPPGF